MEIENGNAHIIDKNFLGPNGDGINKVKEAISLEPGAWEVIDSLFEERRKVASAYQELIEEKPAYGDWSENDSYSDREIEGIRKEFIDRARETVLASLLLSGEDLPGHQDILARLIESNKVFLDVYCACIVNKRYPSFSYLAHAREGLGLKNEVSWFHAARKTVGEIREEINK